MENNKTFISQSMKGGILAFIISTLFVLLLALVAKLFTMSADILPYVNQVLKAIAVVVATIVCVRDNSRLWKALLVAAVFVVLNLILYAVLGGEFNWVQVLIDLAISIVVAVLTSMFLGRRASR